MSMAAIGGNLKQLGHLATVPSLIRLRDKPHHTWRQVIVGPPASCTGFFQLLLFVVLRITQDAEVIIKAWRTQYGQGACGLAAWLSQRSVARDDSRCVHFQTRAGLIGRARVTLGRLFAVHASQGPGMT